MDIDESDFDYEDELEIKYQISYTSGKPAPMKVNRKKRLSPWQRIELLKDEARLNKQIADCHFDFYE